MSMNPPDTAIYYTFSTISQSLAGAIALLAAFVLYRFQLLDIEIQGSTSHLRTFATGDTRQQMDVAMAAGRHDKILELAVGAPNSFVGVSSEEIDASRT